MAIKYLADSKHVTRLAKGTPVNTTVQANRLQSTFQLVRYQQWIKNLIVFAAPLFARRLDDPAYLFATVAAFVSFCLVSSAVYVMNDLVDMEQDKIHPTKKDRALAAGQVSAWGAQCSCS